ncbi:CPCC family cysteine-rich protein [Xenorhabdus anantnagensis]|nr:CPCC family cysteine-rich protein [Xenorhabdus anantnagensis]
MILKYPCSCCNNTPFEFIGEYNICPICKWEDDPIQN